MKKMVRLALLIALVSSTARAADTGVILSNWSTATVQGYALPKAMTFTQNFSPQEGGSPTELVVNAGAYCGSGNPGMSALEAYGGRRYTFSLTLSSGGSAFFTRQYEPMFTNDLGTGCRFNFPISTTGAFQKGQPASFALTALKIEHRNPTTFQWEELDSGPSVGAITTDNAAFPRTSYSNGTFALRFQMKANTATVSAAAPTNGSILWDDGSVCGTSCSQTQNIGARHTYTAQTAAPWGVTGWGGPCAGQGSPCTVAAAANMTPITVSLAEFFTINITRPSYAGNTVSAHCGTYPCNLDCGSVTTGPNACSASLPRGLGLTFTGLPKYGTSMKVSGWNGCTQMASYPNKCQLTVGGPANITAYFSSSTGGVTQ